MGDKEKWGGFRTANEGKESKREKKLLNSGLSETNVDAQRSTGLKIPTPAGG